MTFSRTIGTGPKVTLEDEIAIGLPYSWRNGGGNETMKGIIDPHPGWIAFWGITTLTLWATAPTYAVAAAIFLGAVAGNKDAALRAREASRTSDQLHVVSAERTLAELQKVSNMPLAQVGILASTFDAAEQRGREQEREEILAWLKAQQVGSAPDKLLLLFPKGRDSEPRA